MAPKPIQLRLNPNLRSYVELVAKTRNLSVPEAIAEMIARNQEDINLQAVRTPEFIQTMRRAGATWPEISKRLGEPKTTIQSRLQTAIARGEVK